MDENKYIAISFDRYNELVATEAKYETVRDFIKQQCSGYGSIEHEMAVSLLAAMGEIATN